MRAVVFDLDGLLVDTESPDFAAWECAYREHGFELPRDAWCARIGSDGARFDPLTHLRELVGAGFDECAMQQRRRAHRDALLEGLAPMQGVTGLLDAAERAGLATAVASSSEREWVIARLAGAGLAGRFRVLCCREDVPRVKPDPALYRKAVADLGVEPSHAIAFEDSPNGVAAAVAAGLFCVAVPGPMTRDLDLSAAHLVIDSLAGASLEDLITAAWH